MSARPNLGPKPTLGYTANRLERAAELRTDAAALARMAANPAARAYVIGIDWIVMKAAAPLNDPLFTLPEARALGSTAETVFLGTLDGAPRFGVGLSPTDAEALKTRDGFLVTDLRSVAVQGLVAPDHLPPIAEAKAVLHWHARHRFCPNCGAPTAAVDAGWKRLCPACKTEHFPRTDPVVIMLLTRGDACLMARQARFAPGMYSCIAGFIEPGETFEDAVRRESFEEAGLRTGAVRYIASQPWPFPGSLMIGCVAEALNDEIVLDMTELEAGRWFSRAEALQMLDGAHPDGLSCPQHIAIANTLLKAWAVDREEA